MENIIWISIFLICAGAFLVWLIAVIDSTIKKKGLLGINLRLVNCPKCDAEVPQIRTPNSVHQAMWGGWTCSNCGCEIDKWGKERNTVNIETAQKQIREAQVNFVESFDEKGKTPVEKIFEENNK